MSQENLMHRCKFFLWCRNNNNHYCYNSYYYHNNHSYNPHFKPRTPKNFSKRREILEYHFVATSKVQVWIWKCLFFFTLLLPQYTEISVLLFLCLSLQLGSQKYAPLISVALAHIVSILCNTKFLLVFAWIVCQQKRTWVK